jgi:hypothetical protein
VRKEFSFFFIPLAPPGERVGVRGKRKVGRFWDGGILTY